jgi:hypothetical protein
MLLSQFSAIFGEKIVFCFSKIIVVIQSVQKLAVVAAKKRQFIW